MDENPLLDIESHIDGKNARVRLYPDRVEWERGKSVSGAKIAAGAMTFGLSLAATGVNTRKGAGTTVIPMRSINSVTTRRDSMVNEVVSVITAGSTVDMRCSKKEAERLKELILDGIAGRLVAPATASPLPVSPTPAAQPSATPPPPPPSAVPAGWYPDPSAGVQRYWDGAAWTEHTAPLPPG